MNTPSAVNISNLQVEAEKVSPCYQKLTVTVPFSKIAKDLEKACRQLAVTHKVPGFRKGKVPLSVIKNKLGKKVVHGALYESILSKLLYESIAQSGIKPIAAANCQIISFEEDQPLKFQAILPTEPKVRLGDYKDIEVWQPVIEITEEEVEEEITGLRRQEASTEEKRGPAELGDLALVDVEAKIDGKRVSDKCFTNYVLELRLPSPEAELVENVIGSKAGEHRVFAVDIPSAEGPQKLSYRVKIKKVRTLRLATMDETFLKKLDCATVEELPDRVKNRLRKQKEEAVTDYLAGQALEKLMTKSSFDIPRELVEMLTDWRFEDTEANIKQEHGRSLEEQLKIIGMPKEEFERDLVQRTLKELQEEIMLLEIAEQHNLEPTDEEVAYYGVGNGLLPQFYVDDPKTVVAQLKALNSHEKCVRALKKTKALDYLMSQVTMRTPPDNKDAPSASSSEGRPDRKKSK